MGAKLSVNAKPFSRLRSRRRFVIIFVGRIERGKFDERMGDPSVVDEEWA